MTDKNESNFNYYHQYCRIYMANQVLLTQMKQYYNQRQEMILKFGRLQKKYEQILKGTSIQDDKIKRFRRTANEIDRHYRCPEQTCQRSYGSQGSRNQHIKIKHYQLYIELELGQPQNIGQNSQIHLINKSKVKKK